MNSSDPEAGVTPEFRAADGRRPWRRPVLRKIDALDARQVKTRSRHDAVHLS